MWRIMLWAVAFCAVAETSKLPSYVSRCSWKASPAEINACAEKNANIAIPKFAAGDKKYRIPSLKPLVIPKMGITQGTSQVGMTLNWEPAKLYGLDTSKVSNMNMDTKKLVASFDVLFPRFTIGGHYKAGGRILLLPVTGEGESNITLTDLKVHYRYDWPWKKGADGKTYAEIVNGEVSILDVGFMSIKLGGLFGGDRLLGDNMHTFLNENWKEVLKELGPGVGEAVGEVVKLVVANLAQVVPISEMFADAPV